MIERVIQIVETLRVSWAQEAVRNPNRENPLFAYGEACGRDAAAQLIREAIEEMIVEVEDDGS